jgi:hypothetical protein
MSTNPTLLGPGQYEIPAGSSAEDADDTVAFEEGAVLTVPSVIPPPPPTPLEITTTSLPGATVGTTYAAGLLATGGLAPYTWSVSAGNLPAGLSLTAAEIGGVPTASGTTSFTVKVTDSEGPPTAESESLSIVVAAAAPPPPPTSVTAMFFMQGQNPATEISTAASYNVTANGITQYGNNSSPFGYSAPPAMAGKRLMLGLGPCAPALATSIAQNLVANGYANAIIRWGWEMNGNWFAWGTQGGSMRMTDASFVAAWVAGRAAMMAVPGAAFDFCWNISMSSTIPTGAYPGDAEVTSIGIDGYNYSGYEAQYNALLAFRAQHNKPLVIGEFGCESGSGRSGDDPTYMKFVLGVIADPANACEAWCYFNSPALSGFPNAEAYFKANPPA